jgi:hypothetical protein
LSECQFFIGAVAEEFGWRSKLAKETESVKLYEFVKSAGASRGLREAEYVVIEAHF